MKKPKAFVADLLWFVFWGWFILLKDLMWFRSLERKSRKFLASADPKTRGLGRSVVMFMCEIIYFELTYLHARGGFFASRHLKLVDYAASMALEKGDVEKKQCEQWKNHCYETVGFVGPNRVLPNKRSENSSPLVITETVKID